MASIQTPCVRSSQPLRVLAGIPSFFRRFVLISHKRHHGKYASSLSALVSLSHAKPGASIQLVAVKRSTECRAAVEPSASGVDEVTVIVNVPQYVTSLGQELRVVGATPALGSWDIHSAPSMTWQDGHAWTLQIRLPVGQHEFKLAVVSNRGIIWEDGADRKILIKHGEKLLGPEAKVSVTCDFNATDATKLETKYDKAFLQDRLNKAQKMVVSLTSRKLNLQKQLVTLLHQAQDTERVTKELVVGVLAADGSSTSQLQPPRARTPSGLPHSRLDGLHNMANQDAAMSPINSEDDASEADMESLDAQAMQRALSSSLQQLMCDPSTSPQAATEATDRSSDSAALSLLDPTKAESKHIPSSLNSDVLQPADMSALAEENIFRSIDVHRGLVGTVKPDWYATSVTASLQDEVEYGFSSVNLPPPSNPEASTDKEPFADVVSHAVSLDEDADFCSSTTFPSFETAEIPDAASFRSDMAARTSDQPAITSHPLSDAGSVSEDQQVWTDLMVMMVHSHFWHMLRLSSPLGRPQLLLLQLSVAITAASVGRGWPLSSATSSTVPTAKPASGGLFETLSKAFAPVSAITRRIFPATTAALVGVVAIGWYARVASAGVN